MHVLNFVAFAHVPKETKTKLDFKTVKCIFIDYCEKIKGYRLYNPINQYVIITHDVIFDDPKNLMGKWWFQGWILDQNKCFQIKTKDGGWKNSSTNVRKSNNGWRRCESFILFFVDVDEPHSFVKALNGEDSWHWKKAIGF